MVALHAGRSHAGKADAPASDAKSALIRRAIELSVAAVFDVDLDILQTATRGPAPAAFARQVAMYLAHVVCGLTLTEVGRIFGRDRTTVAYGCGVVEDARDDADFDAKLTHLERGVSALVEALQSSQRGWV